MSNANSSDCQVSSMSINWPALLIMILEVRGVGQAELGEEIGVTQQTISNWINGVRHPYTKKRRDIRLLCNQLKINIENFSKKRETYEVGKRKLNTNESTLIDATSGMTPTQMRDLIRYANFLKS